MIQLSFAGLMLRDLEAPMVVDAAARAGFARVGLRTGGTHATYRAAIRDEAMLIEVQRAMRHAGLHANHLSAISLGPNWQKESVQRLLDWGSRLGAHYLVAVCDTPVFTMAAENLDRSAALCAGSGIKIAVEFMPSSPLDSMKRGLELLDACGQADATLLFDTLHFHRSGGMPADLITAAISRFGFIDLADAEREGPSGEDVTQLLEEEAYSNRLPPGEGGLPLVDILRRLPENIPINVEAPCQRLREELPDPVDFAEAMFTAASRVLAAAGRH